MSERDHPTGLSDRDTAILAVESRTWLRPGAKEQHVFEHLDLSATRYAQILNRLLDDPAALEHDPQTVWRLRRLREARVRRRRSI